MPTLSAFWSSLIYDPFPALFFALVRFWNWCGVGTSDEGLRYLGLLIGLGITTAIWITGWSIKKAPPTLALLLFGLSPVVLVWGDSLRAYGFSCIWNILLIGLIWKLIRERPQTKHIILAAITALLSVHSIFPNAFFLFAAGMGATAIALRHRWWRAVFVVIGIGVLSALSLLPYAPIIRDSGNWTQLAKSGVGVGWIFHMIFEAIHSGGSVAAGLWIGCALFALVGVIVGFFTWTRLPLTETQRDLLIYAGLTFAIAGVAIISFFRVVGWTTSLWYYVPLMGTAAVCFDALTASFGKHRLSILITTGVVLVAASCVAPLAYRASGVRLTNADLMTKEIADHAQKSDFIVVDNYFYSISFNRYYHGAAPWASVPDVKDRTLHRWDLLTNTMRQSQPIQPVLDRIDQTLKDGHNVFVVGFAPTKRPSVPPPDLPPAPSATSGWCLWRYVVGWTREVAFATQSHAARGKIISIPSQQPVSVAEKLNAFVVSGWHD